MHRSKPRSPLVQVVREIAGDVGRLAVALDHDAVLVVAKIAGAQPGCAVLLVDVAGARAAVAMACVDPAAGVHRVFVGVDVEVGAELVQRLLDVGEHQVDADLAEDLLLLVVGQAQRVGSFVQRPARRCRRCRRPRSRRAGPGSPLAAAISELGEPVDLRAVVVEVVLRASRRRPGVDSSRPSASPTAAHRVPPMWIGPVGLAETNSRLMLWPA